jgi:hypothetical protein
MYVPLGQVDPTPETLPEGLPPPPEDAPDPALGWVFPVLFGFGLVIVASVVTGYAARKD